MWVGRRWFILGFGLYRLRLWLRLWLRRLVDGQLLLHCCGHSDIAAVIIVKRSVRVPDSDAVGAVWKKVKAQHAVFVQNAGLNSAAVDLILDGLPGQAAHFIGA